jgi:uncharacterized protein YndB with AHSA1/START domain
MSTTKGKGQQEEEETIEIRKSIIIDASPEVIFKAITDPNELTNWFPDQAILEPKIGGKMKFGFYKNSKEGTRIMAEKRTISTKELLSNLFQIRKFPTRGKIRTSQIFQEQL